ncbi:MAG: hypothetical protein D6729_01005 [Deltaproteobacteria bacterium]|nr:MAG: hypothetical protein D6729_01005 [Deltaproteobacteria bacterium]
MSGERSEAQVETRYRWLPWTTTGVALLFGGASAVVGGRTGMMLLAIGTIGALFTAVLAGISVLEEATQVWRRLYWGTLLPTAVSAASALAASLAPSFGWVLLLAGAVVTAWPLVKALISADVETPTEHEAHAHGSAH